MRTLLSALVFACLVVPQSVRAFESSEIPRHEIWLGFGGGTAAEESIFNIPDDLASEPEMLISLGYVFNLDASNAIGLHIYGGSETLPELFLLPPGNTSPVPVTFELNTYHTGLRLRHTFTQKRVAPYAWVGLSMAQGVISSVETGELEYHGYSVGGGPGVLFRLSRRVSLAVEGVATFGSAKWKTEPFANSTSRDFNPGLFGVIANLSFGWGRVR